jgi:hypothetical protein
MMFLSEAFHGLHALPGSLGKPEGEVLPNLREVL